MRNANLMGVKTMKHVPECITRLSAAGVSWEDAFTLRRIAMTLHRWHELECGDSNDYASWFIARGHKKNGAFEYDDNGAPYLERHLHSENGARYSPIPDRERGALKRLAKIMAKYDGLEGRPILAAYVQGDPRGASLYILRQGDVPQETDVSSCYNRGIAVYK